MIIEWNKVTWYSKLGALIVLIVTVSLGFYFWNEYQKIQTLENSVLLNTPQLIKSPITIEELGESETQDWQTYTNEELGFEFQYPESIFGEFNILWDTRNKSVGIGFRKEVDGEEKRILFFDAYNSDAPSARYSFVNSPFFDSDDLKDVESYCQEPLRVRESEYGFLEMCKIVEIDSSPAVFATFAGLDHCVPYFAVHSFFDRDGNPFNENSVGLLFSLGGLEAGEQALQFMPNCLDTKADRKRITADFLEASMKIMEDNESLSDSDRIKIEAFNQILSTFRFIDSQNSQLDLNQIENSEYYLISYNQTVQLKDGYYREVIPGMASGLEVNIYKDKVAFGDLNGDKKQDAAIILDSTGGGSGSFRELAIILNQEENLSYFTSIELGDRVTINSVVIQAEEIILDMVIHGPEDGLCCPSIPILKRYKLSGEELIETQ